MAVASSGGGGGGGGDKQNDSSATYDATGTWQIRKVIVLADSSKVGVELLVTFASLSDIDVLITDSGISDNDRVELTNAGMEVVIA